METNFNNKYNFDFYSAFTFLNYHKIFNGSFSLYLDVDVVKVNPQNLTIEDDDSLNTLTQVWLECGPYERGCITHDIDLDCGGDTFEDAIIELATLVRDKYGE